MGDWTSALYPRRVMPRNGRDPVAFGFCWVAPTILPRSCTWCGRPMRLVTPTPPSQPIVACDVCDHWGAWP